MTGVVRSGGVLAGIAAGVAVSVAIVAMASGRAGHDVTRQVEMVGSRFDPVTIRVPASAPQVEVHNGDLYLHDIALPETGLHLRIAPDRTTTVSFDGVEPGTYTVYCTLHSDTSEPDPARAGMAATLVVEP